MAGEKPGVYLEGLTQLRRALGRADRQLGRTFTGSLREIAKDVRQNVRARTDEFKRSGDLGRSIRYSVRAKAASVYSDLPYAGVQERGGRVGHGAIIPRATAHRYMTRGVEDSRRMIEQRLEGVLDDLADTWGDGRP